MKISGNNINKRKIICTEREYRMILSNFVISNSDDIYDLDLNILRKFRDDYFARNEKGSFQLFQVSEKIIDQLILEFASCIKDSIDTEEYDEALEYTEVVKDLCNLKASNIDKAKLW